MPRNFFPRKQSITFSNTRLVFISQPVDFGIELIKLFLQRFLFSQCFVSINDPVTGINLFPVRFIADYFMIKFFELDQLRSCQIF